MKTTSAQNHRHFQLSCLSYGSYYIERVCQLEKMLARKPRSVEIELIGAGEIPADSALLLRSVLLARSAKTRVTTNARSSIQNGAVLIWLLGDSRMMREDACLYFRKSNLSDEEEAELNKPWTQKEEKYRDSFSEIEPDEADYSRVLQLINEFLPVKELAGRMIGAPILKQFGLIENEQVDGFLATAFAKCHGLLVSG
jgi:hypothetical protein